MRRSGVASAWIPRSVVGQFRSGTESAVTPGGLSRTGLVCPALTAAYATNGADGDGRVGDPDMNKPTLRLKRKLGEVRTHQPAGWTLAQRIRWEIAILLDWLTPACWARLYCWADFGPDPDTDHTILGAWRGRKACRAEARKRQRNHDLESCWCGKFRYRGLLDIQARRRASKRHWEPYLVVRPMEPRRHRF